MNEKLQIIFFFFLCVGIILLFTKKNNKQTVVTKKYCDYLDNNELYDYMYTYPIDDNAMTKKIYQRKNVWYSPTDSQVIYKTKGDLGPDYPTRPSMGSTPVTLGANGINTPYNYKYLGISDPEKVYIRWPLL